MIIEESSGHASTGIKSVRPANVDAEARVVSRSKN
jgi:hypothetical protein